MGKSQCPDTGKAPDASQGWQALLRPHLMKRYVIFSAISLSPTSKEGNMEREGMKRGSAMNLQRTDKV
jgi:hypothetical protein